jgi:cytosine/adenosine deaminase-related metal-dependent hydrolase
VADISRTGANVRPLSVSPIRKVCFIELISGAGQCPSDAGELFGLVAAPAALSEPGRLLIGVSPHSLYNVTESDLAAIGRRLVDSPRPMTVHFLEAQDEARWLRDRSGPAADFRHRHPLREVRDYPSGDAVDILARCGLLGVRPILAHGNDVQPADFPTLAAAGASVVWCPRTCAYFGHGPHPWGSMLRAGLNVCLGTDSLASNPDLSILEEMRYVRRHVASAPASTILKMATIFAARALGLDAWIGQLAAGRRADFVCVPWDGDGASDPVGNLLEGPGAAGGVWIDGIRVDVPVA